MMVLGHARPISTAPERCTIPPPELSARVNGAVFICSERKSAHGRSRVWNSRIRALPHRQPANAGSPGFADPGAARTLDAPLLVEARPGRRDACRSSSRRHSPPSSSPERTASARPGRSAARARLPGRPPARLRLSQLRFHQLGRLFRQADPHPGRHRPEGIIRGIKLVDHKEPIVLVGIPERRIVDARERASSART